MYVCMLCVCVCALLDVHVLHFFLFQIGRIVNRFSSDIVSEVPLTVGYTGHAATHTVTFVHVSAFTIVLITLTQYMYVYIIHVIHVQVNLPTTPLTVIHFVH